MQSYVPIILGGIFPAVLWGMTAIFQKLSAGAGLPPGGYLSVFGFTIFLSGIIAAHLSGEVGYTLKNASLAALAGLCFALGAGLLSFVLWRFNFPISRLAPILAANTLVPVVIGIVVLGEGADVNLTKLIFGTIFVMVGVLFVTSA